MWPMPKHIEEAFRAKLLSFAIHQTGRKLESTKERQKPDRTDGGGMKAKSTTSSPSVDKSGLMHPEPRRIRDRDHVRFVAQQMCLVCGRQPCDAHHLRFAQNRALGRRVSDEFTVPLCRGHHRDLASSRGRRGLVAESRPRSDRRRASAVAQNPSTNRGGDFPKRGRLMNSFQLTHDVVLHILSY
jgi:hypothetical protein